MPTRVFVQENETSAPLTIDDRIFLGEGLFETLRVVGKKPLYPEAHWQRLRKAAFFLEIPFDLSLELWLEKLNHCIRLKKLYEGGIKAILSGGSASRGLVARSSESHLLLNAFHYVLNSEPLNLISAPWQRDAKNPIYPLKSVNYLEAIIARRYAEAKGADDVVFFNFQQHLTETTIANLFILKNNCLVTPTLHSGVLPGIIRQRLLVLCKERGISCSERELHKESFTQADGAFVCNALQGLRIVRSFDGHIFNVDHPLIELLKETLLTDPN